VFENQKSKFMLLGWIMLLFGLIELLLAALWLPALETDADASDDWLRLRFELFAFDLRAAAAAAAAVPVSVPGPRAGGLDGTRKSASFKRDCKKSETSGNSPASWPRVYKTFWKEIVRLVLIVVFGSK